MEEINELEDLYKHLEEKALDYKYPHQIGVLFHHLRDLKSEAKQPEEAEKAQWEVDAFNFMMGGCEIKPRTRRTTDKGDSFEYPAISRLDERECAYLISRAGSTSNSLLKARYAHILWCSPKKHAKYATQAADAYLDLIKIYEEKDKTHPEQHFGLDVLQAVKNACSLAKQINCKIEIVKSELIRLVKEFNFASSSSFALRASIIELMLKEKKYISKDCFKDFEGICWKVSETLTEKGNLQGSIDMLRIGKRIDQKIGQSTCNWDERVAQSYEQLTKEAEEKGNLAYMNFCQAAIEHYKAIKNSEKVKELEKKYSELKKGMKLQQVGREIDVTEQVERAKEIAKKIAKQSPEAIIKILVVHKDILPRYKDMEKKAEESSKNFVFPHLGAIETIDQSGHTAQHFSDENEKERYLILYEYDLAIKLNKMVLMNQIFLEAIKKENLSGEILTRFLKEHSWYGKAFSKTLPGSSEAIEQYWLGLLAPAIHEYFYEMEVFLLSPRTNLPNFVLSMDSLIVKLEGLIRDLCEFSGITTFYMTKDNKGRNIIQEKDINALLYEEDVKKLFDEDDLLFLRYLLIEKAGLNLRNKVAHSLMAIHDYNAGSMHLVMLALLRLAKYNVVAKVGKEAEAQDGKSPKP